MFFSANDILCAILFVVSFDLVLIFVIFVFVLSTTGNQVMVVLKHACMLAVSRLAEKLATICLTSS